MQRKKKIYYIPGMISLIGLPILMYFLIPKPAPKFNSIRIVLPYDEKPDDRIGVYYSKQNLYKSISKRKIIELNLFQEDSAFHDLLLKRKFDFISRELERISFTGDTATVLKININDSNTLGDIVWLVNRTLIYNIRRWAIADNSFYFVNIKPSKEKPQNRQITFQTL